MQPDSNVIIIPLEKAIITKIADDLSKSNTTYDEYCWFIAECELRLKPLYTSEDPFVQDKIALKKGGSLGNPAQEEIKKLAEVIYYQGTPPKELHWFLAERRYIMAKIKSNEYNKLFV
jgi:hypothetical protein